MTGLAGVPAAVVTPTSSNTWLTMCAGTARSRAIGDSGVGVRGVVVTAAVLAAGLTGSEVRGAAGGDAACPDEAVAARRVPRPGVSITTGSWTAAVETGGAVEAVSANEGLAEAPSLPGPEVSWGV